MISHRKPSLSLKQTKINLSFVTSHTTHLILLCRFQMPIGIRFKDKELELRHMEEKRENIQHTRAALAMCENIDWNVGRILDRLDELKLSENTIVIYFCDNGPNGRRWNGKMKGRKGSTDEGGVRSPLIMRWPAKINPGTVINEIGGAIDLLPTLAALANIECTP
jgi:arylsulfatase A-like enzyme